MPVEAEYGDVGQTNAGKYSFNRDEKVADLNIHENADTVFGELMKLEEDGRKS